MENKRQCMSGLLWQHWCNAQQECGEHRATLHTSLRGECPAGHENPVLYHAAFWKNDGDRYQAFLDAVQRGEATMHADTLYPYEIIAAILDRWNPMDEKNSRAWKLHGTPCQITRGERMRLQLWMAPVLCTAADDLCQHR